MTHRLHHLIALVMHPVLITFYGLTYLTSTHVVAYGRMVENQTIWFLVILFLSTSVIPLLTLGLLFKKFTIREWASISVGDRRSAAMIMGAVYILLYFAYRDFFPDVIIGVFLISAGVSSILSGIAQLWMKVSFHMLALAGLLVLVLFMARQAVGLLDPLWPVTIVVMLTGVVGWSRMAIKAHRPAEIYTGYFLGLLTTTAVFYITYGF